MTFNLTSRFSEGGRSARAGKREVGRGMRSGMLQAARYFRLMGRRPGSKSHEGIMSFFLEIPVLFAISLQSERQPKV